MNAPDEDEDLHRLPETPWLDQGSVFESVNQLPVLAEDGRSKEVATPLGVAVVSQTCDNVRARWVQVSPVVHLEGHVLADAAKGRTSKYAPLPAAGVNLFAELATIATISKKVLREDARVQGVVTLADARRLAQSIGRRYSRFAFPDELVSWLDPLRKVAQKKAWSQVSPEGQALARISQIRMRSENGWSEAPFILGVTLLLDEGELTFDSTLDVQGAAELRTWLDGRGAADVAGRLGNGNPSEQSALLQALGEAWLAKCAAEGQAEVVSSYSVDVASADEYSLAAYFDSEALDFDHLSPPTMST